MYHKILNSTFNVFDKNLEMTLFEIFLNVFEVVSS